MAFPKAPPKDPDELLDYGLDWGAEYLPRGDELETSNWDVPDGLTKEYESRTAGMTKVWLAGGSIGEEYTVTNHVQTKGGRQADRSFTVKVKQK